MKISSKLKIEPPSDSRLSGTGPKPELLILKSSIYEIVVDNFDILC
jgi:hypothetical protein